MSADFDWIGIMTYDYYGGWTSVSGPNSALFGSFSTNTEGWVDNSVEYYNSTCAVPKEKLLIGVPFYGWSFRASSMYGPSTGAGQLPYSSIVPLIQQGWSRFWDATGQVPYLINPAGTQVISYDDSLSVGAKCGYVKTKGLAGVIVWAIGQDRVNGNQPLLKTLGLGLLVGVRPIAEAPVPTVGFLFQNYPNPYNAVTRIRYAVAEHGKVEVNLYDALGRQVRTLVKGEFLPGEYEVTVSSDDLPSGCYIYRLTTQHFSTAKIMVVLR